MSGSEKALGEIKPLPQLVAVSISHKAVEVEEREKFSLSDVKRQLLLEKLSEEEELAIVETCNRVEVILVTDSFDEASYLKFFASVVEQPVEAVSEILSFKYNKDAVTHLFRVAAGLESAILGESQILGQLKDAWNKAHQEKHTGPVLNRLFHDAFRFAKKVRTNTALGRHSLSAAVAINQLGKQIFGSLADCSVMLVGTGEIGLLAMKHLQASGCERVYVSSRDPERAAEVASEFSAFAVSNDSIKTHLSEVDIFVSAQPGFSLSASQIERHISNRPMLFVDLTVPRSLDPAIADLERAFLFNIDHLQQIVSDNLAKRESEAEKVEKMLPVAVDHFTSWRRSRPLEFLIDKARRDFEKSSLEEEVKIVRRLRSAGCSDETLFIVKKALGEHRRSLGAKLLHKPVTSLKKDHGARRWFARWFLG